jgi:transposase, IS5 family
MRRLYHEQLPLCPTGGTHPKAAELAEMSRVLDTMGATLHAVRRDLVGRVVSVRRGREGLSAEQVLRAALVKKMFRVSYDELAFHLEDSGLLRAFCRLSPSSPTPKKSALQANIAAIRPSSWEAMNKAVMLEAGTRKVEDGRWMRTDATVVQANIHHPLDSALLWDGVRVLTRLLSRANEEFGISVCNHARRAKRRSIAILHAGTMQRRLPLYRDLLKVTSKTLLCAQRARAKLESIGGLRAFSHADALRHFLPLVAKVIDQTERRVLRGEQVPASEKIVSIFEPHTDIIRKDRRETHYGHKVTLSTGRSGLVLDLVVEDGNPADSTLAVRSTERHAAIFGSAPQRVAFDGGFASKKNLEQIKSAGTVEVCFSKPAGVPVEQMTTSLGIRRTLKRFRAGIEAGISFLKRSFGWARVTGSGLSHFRASLWCSTVAHNLLVFARTLLARARPKLA